MTYFFLKSIFLLHHLEFLKNAIVMFPRKVVSIRNLLFLICMLKCVGLGSSLLVQLLLNMGFLWEYLTMAFFCSVLQKYGSIPTKEDIEKTGDQCAICHDTYTTPVLLKCNHIFCENCIGSWFRTETTCPMCRAKVAEDMSWLDGQTTQFIQIFWNVRGYKKLM